MKETNKIVFFFVVFLFYIVSFSNFGKMKTMYRKNNMPHNVYVLKYIYKFLILRCNS